MRPPPAVTQSHVFGAAGDTNVLFAIADGKVVYANRKGEEALGVSRKEGSSRGFAVFRMVAVAPEYLDLIHEDGTRWACGEEAPPAGYALLTRDGRRIEGMLASELIELEGRQELLGIFTGKKAVRGS